MIIRMVSGCNFVDFYLATEYEYPEKATPGDTTKGRLPTSIVPMYYDVEFQPDFYETGPVIHQFNGTVLIRFRVLETTSTLYLNSLDLVIPVGRVQVTAAIDSPIPAEDPLLIDARYDTELHFYILTVQLGGFVAGAEYYVYLEFYGTMDIDTPLRYGTYPEVGFPDR